MSCPAHALAEVTAPCVRCGVAYCDDCLVTLHNERVCATCKGEVLRDVISGADMETLPLARLGPRFVAWLLDRMMLWTLQGVTVWLSMSGRIAAVRGSMRAMLFLQILLNVLNFIYEGAMVAGRGQTLGKMAMRVRVVRPDSSPVEAWQAWARAGVRLGGYLIVAGSSFVVPAFGAIVNLLVSAADYIPGLATKERTALHDLLARTRVVREDA